MQLMAAKNARILKVSLVDQTNPLLNTAFVTKDTTAHLD
jgi:hypothetical protein